MDLVDISLAWSKMIWPDFSSAQGIIAFSINISAKESLVYIVPHMIHRLKMVLLPDLPQRNLGTIIGGTRNTSYVLISHYSLSLHE